MSTPRYFRDFPNVQYAVKVNKAGQPKYISIKDYFHLLVPRDDIFREETLYSKYLVHDGQRPDEISYAVYGDEQFYWVILQINQITDYYTQWPLQEAELNTYVLRKYGGSAGAGAVHHWETVKTFDEATPPNLVLQGGLEVPENFIYYYPTIPGENQRLSTTPVSVSNYQYERDLNEKKAEISILNPRYIYDYAREVKTYAKNLDITISFTDSDVLAIS